MKKNILFFILGAIIFGSIGVVASTMWASDITYTKEDNSKVTVQKAIDDLYKSSLNSGVQNIGLATGATVNATTTDEDGNLVGKTYYAEVYLDPTDLSKECNATNSASNFGKTGLKTGCMRWYAYTATEENGKTKYDLILDHNTTTTIQWVRQQDYVEAGGALIKSGNTVYNNKGPLTAKKEIDSLVGLGWKVRPRMITADEIAHIVGADRDDTIK